VQSDWAAEQLSLFLDKINTLFDLDADAHLVGRPTEIDHDADELEDELTMLEPVMCMVMNAARPGLGDYVRDSSVEYHHRYRWSLAKREALRAKGIHLLGAEAKARCGQTLPSSSPTSSTSGFGMPQGRCGRAASARKGSTGRPRGQRPASAEARPAG
jgi:hypothetical protein